MSARQNGGHRTRAEERAAELDISPTKLLETIEGLQTELEKAHGDRDEYLAALQRERAEFQNFRRRSEEERQRSLGLAAEDLIRKVLGVADDFDRAIAGRPEALAAEPWTEGIVAIDRKLRSLLESEGVTPVEGSPGTPFDPRLHEAIANVPTDAHPDGAIVDEVRRGYLLRDRVIRPALVAVATGTGAPTADTPTTEPTDRS